MEWMRRHWFDLGGFLAVIVLVGVAVLHASLTPLQTVLWLSLASLFVHQFEEYRYPGTFPGMLNLSFQSERPDRYPLNPQTSLVVNVAVGWTAYFLAAVFAERAIWLAIATILITVGNVAAHSILFPLRRKKIYNAGLLTAVTLFLPIIVAFGVRLARDGVVGPVEIGVGIALGVAMNYVGFLKILDWMKDPDTPFAFPPRCVPPLTNQEEDSILGP